MGQIKKLDGYLISKIAAGEVLQGIHSVVKELVENSLDAGATKIDVFIENGGFTGITVKDDGKGILPEDMELALTRHATSKIDSFEALLNLASYGFRGEALASISSVSRIELQSSTEEDSCFSLVLEGGEKKDFSPTVCQRGTKVEVQDIFFNVPARRKFLKTPRYESLRAKKALACLALANLGVSFSWSEVEQKKNIRVGPDSDLIDRYCAFISPDLMDHFVPFERIMPDIKIYGILGEPFVAAKKPFSPVFVNKRAVAEKSISAAVRAGFGSLVFDRLPVFAVFIEIDPALVDVNVHPSKDEVKLSDQGFVFREVRRAVENALSKSSVKIFDTQTFNVSELEVFKEKTDVETSRQIETENHAALKENMTIYENAPFFASSFFQIHDTYIVVETKGGVIFIDQHAAAERILYEEILYKRDIEIQNLLFPVVVNLNEDLWSMIEETKGKILISAGFQIKILSGAITIESVPSGIENTSHSEIASLVRDIIEQEGRDESREKIAARVACKAAIKAGDKLDRTEIEKLVGRLFLCRQPHICPHGRPTMFRITNGEIEKKFGRIK
ncbi:DNA mismatch repair endonuclease MutL [candidate division WOR-3 bacterium]|nr:DNA mismatch repair endonuclease MutL [candidate division WOR-3 bacterium]